MSLSADERAIANERDIAHTDENRRVNKLLLASQRWTIVFATTTVILALNNLYLIFR